MAARNCVIVLQRREPTMRTQTQPTQPLTRDGGGSFCDAKEKGSCHLTMGLVHVPHALKTAPKKESTRGGTRYQPQTQGSKRRTINYKVHQSYCTLGVTAGVAGIVRKESCSPLRTYLPTYVFTSRTQHTVSLVLC